MRRYKANFQSISDNNEREGNPCLNNRTRVVVTSSSLRPGFVGCSENMNDPPYLWFDCLKQDEIFPDDKTRCFPLLNT